MTLKGGRGRHRKYLPFAFAEHGALMAANVLNSPDAVKMSVHSVRAIIKQSEIMLAQADVLKRLAQMDTMLLKHDDALRLIWRELQPLLQPPPAPTKRHIGFYQKKRLSRVIPLATSPPTRAIAPPAPAVPSAPPAG